MKRRHVNEFNKTSFTNSGRIAGAGVSEDRYDDEYIEMKHHHQPKFEHIQQPEHGEVIIRKASEVLCKAREE